MPPAQTPIQIIYIVVVTLASVVLVGICSLALTLFLKAYVDPLVFNVFSNVITGAFSALTAILVNTRQSKNGDDTTPVQIQQPDNQPVPVVPVAEPKT
jgi:hypothetical protein